jgi:hypothetical protein
MKKKKPIYAIYKGDDFLFMGTKKECANYLNSKEEYITFLCSPTNLKRIEQTKKEYSNHKIALRVEDIEE